MTAISWRLTEDVWALGGDELGALPEGAANVDDELVGGLGGEGAAELAVVVRLGDQHDAAVRRDGDQARRGGGALA